MSLVLDGSSALAGLAGAGAGLGVVMVGLGLTGTTDPGPSVGSRWRGRRAAPRSGGEQRAARWRIGAALVGGLLAVVVTGWPVAGLLASAAVWYGPAVLGPDRTTAAAVARAEAVATWAEMLRDILHAAAGLEQALLATAPTVPAPIRGQILALAARIRGGQRLPDALRAAAADLDDPTADLVLAALLQAAEHQARDLGQLLSDLADVARAQAAVRLRQAAERARTRTSARVIIGTNLALAAGLVLFNRSYLAPYDTGFGQLILLIVGALFGAGFWWIARLARPHNPGRHLAFTPTGSADQPPAVGARPVGPGGEVR